MRKVFKDRLSPQGHVEIFVTKGVPALVLGRLRGPARPGLPRIYESCDIDMSNVALLDRFGQKNLILGQGKDRLIETLSGGSFLPVCRMAIGDRGALPSNLQVPKVPVDNDPANPITGLYNEVFRSDIDATVLDVGNGVHEVKYIKIFSAADVPITGFTTQAAPVINEVGLVTADINGLGDPLPRPDVSPPTAPDADEALFSIRTFKSVPFEASQGIAVTIRYTVFIEE